MTDDPVAWRDLFERGRGYETTADAVREVLAARRARRAEDEP